MKSVQSPRAQATSKALHLAALAALLPWIPLPVATAQSAHASDDAEVVARSRNVPAELEQSSFEPTEAALSHALDNWIAFQREGDGVHAAGPGYESRFDTNGFALRPALGREAPELRSIAFELESIRVGDLNFAGLDLDAEPQMAERRVEYQRTADVIEAYDVRVDGVEQSFVFDSLPSRAGDLVVRGRLQTDMQLDTSSAEGIAFRAGEFGGVRIGAVTGVDARGQTAAGALRLDGDFIELSLPQSFVASAQLPLVLDPLIGPDGNINFDSDHADVCWNPATSEWGIAWQFDFSSNNSSVYYSSIGTEVPGPVSAFTVVSADAGLIESRPSLAFNNDTDVFLVAWQESDSEFGPWSVRVRSIFDPAAGAIQVSNAVTIDSGLVVPPEPDAANESTVADDDVLVAYASTPGVIVKQVSVPLDSDPFTLVTTNVSSAPDCSNVAISKSGGSGGRYLVVWQQPMVFGSGHDIYVSAVNRNGFLLDGPQLVVGTGDDERDPDVDGDGNSFLVVWENAASGSINDADIYGRKLDWDGNEIVIASTILEIEGDTNDNEVDPAVALSRNKFFVMWSDEDASFGGSPFEYHIAYVGLDYNTCVLCEAEQFLTFSENWNSTPAMAAQRSSSANTTLDNVLAAYTQKPLLPPFIGDVQLQMLEAIGDGGTQSNLGGGCGGGGTATASGTLAVGDSTFHSLTGADPGAVLGVLNIALPQTPLNCGPCVYVPWNNTIVVGLSNGSGNISLPTPCREDFIGLDLILQWTVLLTSQTPCNLYANVSFSNRLAVTIGE